MVELDHRRTDRMGVRIDKARQHGLAAKVDDARIRAAQPLRAIAVTDEDDPLAPHRHRLRDCVRFVRRDDVAV